MSLPGKLEAARRRFAQEYGPARPRLWYALPRLIRFRVRSVCFRDEDTNGDSDGFAKYRLPPGTPRRQRGPSVRGTDVIMHERYRHARSGADEAADDRVGGEVLPGLDAQARGRARQESTHKRTPDALLPTRIRPRYEVICHREACGAERSDRMPRRHRFERVIGRDIVRGAVWPLICRKVGEWPRTVSGALY